MEQKKRYNFAPTFVFPVLKKSKSGWRVEFYYLNSSGAKIRSNIKCERYRKRFNSDKDAAEWINLNIIKPLSAKLMEGWTPENDLYVEKEKKVSFIELFSKFMKQKETVDYKMGYLRLETLLSYQSNVKQLKELFGFPHNKMKVFDDCPADSLTPANAKKIVLKLKENRCWTNATTNNFIRLCRSAYKYGNENELCKNNPFASVKYLTNDIKERVIMTDEQLHDIYNYLFDKDVPFLFFTQLVYATLARPVELFRVKIKDVNVEDRTIHLGKGKTKNKKARDIIIPDALAPLFELYLSNYVLGKHEELYLFSDNFIPGRKQKGSGYSSARWKELRQALNLPENCQLYSLRHTSITNLLSFLPTNTVRKLADHQSLEMTSIYSNHETLLMKNEIKLKAPIFGL